METVIFIIQAIALIVNLVAGYVEHDTFYIAIAILFAIFMTGDSIVKAIENKED